ncbi:FAD-dependent oxidoreductase [Megasphaera vaginalis (ex Srinivasan et al. 2021)]|uniref:Pyridine nucleotide-disulfide oxidoreductase n=1 Tax=Megasphaera vaginalis (ex Srinivasan et al. 2021) TaxID=1111454 RepID=U7UJT1_9FIRM|nr:FAD-dependent oxidoreductase [Megasphaera vaginalis (ex Srinivasan et al. 2021)]ERT58713.1 pyridine nucleotide-disulfide oxidoreductase [Megasphaera vaginalis (ex Srinivasan et al. 2021)]
MSIKSIAIIGAGPTGYTAADILIKKGYSVEIFEKENKIGGAIYTGIPEYRMSKIFLNKIYSQLVTSGVKFHFNTYIDTKGFKELRNKFERILVATGAPIENTFGFTTGRGLVAGLTLLYDLNIKELHNNYKYYKKAIVWGGGNVAMDCARSLVRIINEVSIVYRRSEEEMTAAKSEVAAAKKENVGLHFLNNIKDIYRDKSGNVIGVNIVKMELGNPDESGRRAPHEIPHSEFTMEADLVIMAIGQWVDLSALDDKLKSENDNDYFTNFENVFIAGDANVGPKTIAVAVKEGRGVAKVIDQSFQL